MPRATAPRVTAGLVALAMTAACGTTVDMRGAAPAMAANDGAAASAGMDVVGPAPAAGATAGAASAGSPSSAGAAAPVTATATAGRPAGPATTGAGGAAGSGSTAAAVTHTTVTLGYLYSSDEQTVANQLGVKGIVAGDTQNQYAALAKDVNANGGILGRRVVLVGYDLSTAGEASNGNAEENKACVDFTQDHRIFALLGSGVYLSPCLAAHGIPSIAGGAIDDPATIDQQLIFDGGGMLTNLLAAVFVDRLDAQGYFSRWNPATGSAGGPFPTRIGLIYQDLPIYRHYYADVKKRLAAHGYHVDPSDEFVYEPSINGVASESQAAVLKFSSDHVTHVFGAALLFFQDAQDQHYHPRYSFDSIVPPQAESANVSASQLHGALGIGWRPDTDVGAAQDPGPVSPLATRCDELMKRAGEDLSVRSTVAVVDSECEQMWSLRSALDRGGALTVPAMTAGFAALGRQPSVVSFGERWSGTRRASDDTVGDLRYVDSCSCFAYGAARTRF